MAQVAIFFDIGETLGIPTGFDADFRLEGLRLYPHVRPILEDLAARQIRAGIISNTSDSETAANMRRVLEEARIYRLFDPALLLYSGVEGLRKDSPQVFARAAEKSLGSRRPPSNASLSARTSRKVPSRARRACATSRIRCCWERCSMGRRCRS